ncbi:MAG: MFS transporter, partial [Roseobacter sp.]
STVTIYAAGFGTVGILTAAGVFGLTTFPIYSVAAAHAHDFASDDERVELSAALMFYFALGAIAAPFIASLLIEAYGPRALFLMIGAGHAVLVLFGLLRMRVRPSPEDRTRYTYAPRTSFLIGRLTGKIRTPKRPD